MRARVLQLPRMKVEAPKHIAVVLFGGVGTRYASKLPKQFAIVGDRPLMCYALRALNESPDVDEILVVAPVAYSKATQDIIHDYRYRKVDAVIDGGKEREDSVFNALAYLYQKGVEPKDIVLICDGDRPNLTPELIKANIEAAIQYGAAVTAIPATDSIIYSEGGNSVEQYLPRKVVYLAQTPQTFQFSLIYNAHLKARRHPKLIFTDDASIAAFSHKKAHIVLGSNANLKITTKQDAAIFLLGRKK